MRITRISRVIESRRATGRFHAYQVRGRNVSDKSEVQPLIDRLAASGGTVLRQGDTPIHGGFRGYVADPDGHSWEIAWNPAWSIDENGLVTFSL